MFIAIGSGITIREKRLNERGNRHEDITSKDQKK